MLVGEDWNDIYRLEIAIVWIIYLFIVFIVELKFFSKRYSKRIASIFKKGLKIATILFIVSTFLFVVGYFYNTQYADSSKLMMIDIGPKDIFVNDGDEGYCFIKIKIKNENPFSVKNITLHGKIFLKEGKILLADFKSKIATHYWSPIKSGKIAEFDLCTYYKGQDEIDMKLSTRKKYLLYEYINKIRAQNIESGNWSRKDGSYRKNRIIIAQLIYYYLSDYLDHEKISNLMSNQETEYERLRLIKKYNPKAYSDIFKNVYNLDEFYFDIKIISAQKVTFIDKLINF